MIDELCISLELDRCTSNIPQQWLLLGNWHVGSSSHTRPPSSSNTTRSYTSFTSRPGTIITHCCGCPHFSNTTVLNTDFPPKNKWLLSPHAPKIRPNHPRLLHRRHQRKFILSRLWSQNTNKPPSIVVVVEKLPSLHYTSWQTLLWCSSSRQVVIVWRYSTTNQQPDFGQHEIFNTSRGVSDTWIAQLLCIISTISRPIRLGSCCVSITHLLYVLPSIFKHRRRSWVYSYYCSCWRY